MAEIVHFSKSYLHEIESGKASAPTRVLEAYAQVKEDQVMKRRTLIGILATTPLGVPHDPASAEMALRYGLWQGDRGNLTEADIWYEVATTLADRTKDQPTQAYVRARAATRGHYEGWPVSRVVGNVQRALALSRRPRVLVEAHAALVQVHTLAGDLPAARAAGRAMLDAATTGDDHIRAAVFVNYLECMIGEPDNAMRIHRQYQPELQVNRTWDHEARVYLGMAQVRAGDRSGMQTALDAMSSFGQEVRMLGIAVTDLLKKVTWQSDEVEQLRVFARV